MNNDVVLVLANWLEPRTARVVVQGSVSDPVSMDNMVYQGTVLGPILWNVYYGDSCMAVRACGFEEVLFADDLNAFKEIDNTISDVQALSWAREC